MNGFRHLRVDRDDRDVVTVQFDLADRPLNIFHEELLRELDLVILRLETDEEAQLVIFRSGKDTGFLAGADVHQIARITHAADAEIVLKLGQELFQRVANLAVPTIAIIHGPCLGGGLEFALACDYRIARNDSATRLGLPETQLGLIPAWGGTQRLPQVVGVSEALKMILTGSHLSAEKAKAIGLVDAAIDPEAFDVDVDALVNELMGTRRRPKQVKGWVAWLRDETTVGQKTVLTVARRQLGRKAKQYPALKGAIHAIEKGLHDGIEAGLATERQEFGRLIELPVTHNLLNLFLRREQARKRETWVHSGADDTVRMKRLGVIGGGTMGAGIAQLAATRGYEVVLKEVNEELADKGMQTIEKLTWQAVKKCAIKELDAEQALSSITATTQLGPLRETDLIVEAIVERMDIKQKVFEELDGYLPESTFFASNTSALSISQMAVKTSRPSKFAGLHFFNPVHKMPLVEVVRAKDTADETVAVLVEVVRKLGKTPIVVAEGPGFLVNRVLFPYLDEAVRMVLEGEPVEEVDREAKRFGMPMGPLELLDTVGLDVAADVSHTLSELSIQESPTPQHLAGMVSAGHKGKKTGQGFYTYKNGKRGRQVAQGPIDSTRDRIPPNRDFGAETLSGIQQRLVFSLINEAADCLHDGIVREPWIVDLGMVLGIGFAPFRGGPLALVDAWGEQHVVETLEGLRELCGLRFNPSAYFSAPHQAKPSTENSTVTSPTNEAISVGGSGPSNS